VSGSLLPPTPALCVDLRIVDRNIDSVLAIAGDAVRLWPHVKTYKSSALVMRLQSRGIRRFKCATVGEAAMLGRAGAREALYAYPVTGPAAPALAALAARYRTTRFSCLVEDAARLDAIDAAATEAATEIGAFVDVDPGQGRTGLASKTAIIGLVDRIASCRSIVFRGLHVYDGHNHQTDLIERRGAVDECIALVDGLVESLAGRFDEHCIVIAGGTPTFPLYAEMTRYGLSPGTAFLYDSGYATAFPDLPFTPAAWVTGRVVSVPRDGVVTLDIGTKAIATDPKGERGIFPDFDVTGVLIHNEEHWVVSHRSPGRTPVVGDPVRVIPTHICPTVNLYNEFYIVDARGLPIGRRRVDARDRVVDP
jgi:D-threonine aldolase